MRPIRFCRSLPPHVYGSAETRICTLMHPFCCAFATASSACSSEYVPVMSGVRSSPPVSSAIAGGNGPQREPITRSSSTTNGAVWKLVPAAHVDLRTRVPMGRHNSRENSRPSGLPVASTTASKLAARAKSTPPALASLDSAGRTCVAQARHEASPEALLFGAAATVATTAVAATGGGSDRQRQRLARGRGPWPHLCRGGHQSHLIHVAAEEHDLRPPILGGMAAEHFGNEEAELAIAYDGHLIRCRHQSLPRESTQGGVGIDGRRGAWTTRGAAGGTCSMMRHAAASGSINAAFSVDTVSGTM